MIQENQQINQNEKISKIIPTWKFILLSVITYGIYELIWFYMTWKLLEKERNLEISPFWRTFFAPFWAGSIAFHIQEFLREKDNTCNYSPVLIGVSYFIISILIRLPDPYWLISFFSFIPMLPLVNAMNEYWQKEEQNLLSKKFTWWEIMLLILGITYFILVILGIFLPE